MKPRQVLLSVWKRLQQPDEVAVVARGAGRSIMVQIVGLGLGYVVHLLLARWLGIADYGAYAYVLAWAALLAVPAGAGVPILVMRFVPEYRVQERWALLHGMLRWGAGLVGAAGTVLALGVTALVAAGGEDVAGAYARPLLVGIWMVPLHALMKVTSGVYQGLHRVGRAQGLAVMRHGLVLGLAFGLWWQRGALTSEAALGVTLLAVCIVLVVQVRPLRRALPDAVRAARAAYAPRVWLRVALPLLLVSGFILLLGQADVLMVGSLLGPRAAGLYGAATRTASLVGIVFLAAVAAAGPMAARLHAEGAHDKLQRLVAAVAHGVFWPSLVLMLALALAAEPVLRLFGPGFPEARWVLVVLALGHLANAGTGIGATVLNLTGHHNRGAAVFGWSALLNVVLNLVGVVLLGLIGAAIATALTMAIQGTAFCFLMRHTLGIDPTIVYALSTVEK